MMLLVDESIFFAQQTILIKCPIIMLSQLNLYVEESGCQTLYYFFIYFCFKINSLIDYTLLLKKYTLEMKKKKQHNKFRVSKLSLVFFNTHYQSRHESAIFKFFFLYFFFLSTYPMKQLTADNLHYQYL